MRAAVMTDIVWRSTIDQGTYEAKVERLGDYAGNLIVTVVSTNEVLLEEEVLLAYQAIFGPDVGDVAAWQDKAITVIDQYIERKGT